MEKEFEALEKLLEGYSKGMVGRSYYDIVKQALTELQAIKEANPSEALEDLDNIIRGFNETTTGMYGLGEVVVGNELERYYKNELTSIKQSLLKTQEQEKVLEIVFKYFDINVVTSNESAFGCITIQRKGCNQMLHQAQKTTFKKEEQEEFELLKRWCEKCLK